MEEIWKSIKDYDGLYEISNFGRVKSLHKGTKFMKQFKNRKGYYITQLYSNGNAKTFIVHRLVAEAFLENPFHKEQVNHINCNKQDNRVENLEWCTNDENRKHAEKNGLMKPPKGGKENSKSIKVNQYDLQGNLIKKWDCIMDVVRSFNLQTGSNICSCCKGRIKSAYGYIWKYRVD